MDQQINNVSEAHLKTALELMHFLATFPTSEVVYLFKAIHMGIPKSNRNVLIYI